MKVFLLLIATILVSCFIFRAECLLKTTNWYQGTTCQSTPFLMTIKDGGSSCNVSSCAPYSNEPTVLSQTFECPTDFPQNPTLKSGEITIYSFSDNSCNTSTINRYDVYKTNVCIKSSIIFGPSAKSGQYIGCSKFVLYSDDSCQTVAQSLSVTLNSCVSGKINKCLSATNSTPVATSSKRSSSTGASSQFIAFETVLVLIILSMFTL